MKRPSKRRENTGYVVAHCNGLRDVKEARTSPLLPPESHRLGSLISEFLLKHLVYFLRKILVCIQHIPPETLNFFYFAEDFGISRETCSRGPSGAPTPPNLRSVIKNRNVSRIG